MIRPLSITLLLIVLLSVPGMAAQSPSETRETKRVLVLYSLDKGHPAHGLTEQGISEVFRANREFDVQLYPEYLDMGRFPGPAQAEAMAEFPPPQVRRTHYRRHHRRLPVSRGFPSG